MSNAERFRDAVRAAVTQRAEAGDAWVEWISSKVETDAVTILYQWVEHRDGRYKVHAIDGRRYRLDEYAKALFGDLSASVEALAAEAASEILEPSGTGRRLKVQWANGLVSDPEAVAWHGMAVEDGLSI